MDIESRWPTLEDVICYNNAKQAYELAEAERGAAEERAWIFWEARESQEKAALSLKHVAERRWAQLVKGRTALSSIARQSANCSEMIQQLRADADELRALYEKRIAASAASAAVPPGADHHSSSASSPSMKAASEGNSNRKRPSASDANTAYSKAVKVGNASAGEGARSRQGNDDAPSGVVKEDDPCPLTEESIRKYLMDLEARLAEGENHAAECRAFTIEEGARVNELESLYRKSRRVWEKARKSPRYQSVMAAFTFANWQLSKKKAAAVRADRTLEATRAIFLKAAALPGGGEDVDDAVKNILHEVQADRFERVDASAKTRSDTPVFPPHLTGIAAFSPSAALRGLLAEAIDRENEGDRMSEAAEARACAYVTGATGTASRRSAQESRWELAALFVA